MLALRAVVAAVVVSAIAGACSGGGCGSDGGPTPSASTSAAPTPSGSAAGPPRPTAAPPVRVGGAIARGAGEDALYVADEDHRALRRVPVPVGGSGAPSSALELPGAPAQVLPLGGRVLVTIRDPGLLLVASVDAGGRLAEEARVSVPADAWGLAITGDGGTALVTSAWTRKATAVDLAAREVRWSVDVAREPRGVVIRADGSAAYVSHLVGSALTRLDDLSSRAPRVSSVALPPAPLRAPHAVPLQASLGYAAVFSPDERRLFVARHALGALGEESWFGASTVDVLLTEGDAPLAPARRDGLPFLRADKSPDGADLAVSAEPLSPFTQPRALTYRAASRTLLVASEGDDVLVELDAQGVDPSRAVLRRIPLGGPRDPNLPVASSCGAPAGVALSADEQTAWVWCRSTYDLATVSLGPLAPDGAPAPDAPPPAVVTTRLAEDPVDAEVSIGRRLFHDATDRLVSGGLACAGCHPEGRDDGHTWHEAKINTKDGTQLNFLGHQANIPPEEGTKGVPRRTPMLAGRVDAKGPYGWHAESPTLEARIGASFGLHRWGGLPPHQGANVEARTARLALFLRRGLVPPPREERALTDAEIRGKQIFEGEEAGCARCHVPASDYTDRVAYPMPRVPVRAGFDDEREKDFKTPSLRFVGGRAPYFHDGRAPTLEWIIDNNDDRMGKTNHLSGVDRAALVAFLRTL